MFDVWLSKNWLHKLYFMQLFKRPNINFMKIRHLMFALTGGATILGAALFAYHLFNGGLNIDFVGGTAYAGQLVHPVALTQLRDRLEKPLTDEARKELGVANDLPDASLEQVFVNDPKLTEGDNSALFTVRTSEKSAQLVMNIVNYKLGPEWGKIVGDKHDPGDLLKRIVLAEPVIENVGGKAVKADLQFAKSTDDFAPAKVPGVVDAVRAALEKELGVTGLQLAQVEGTPGFFTLHATLPEGSDKKIADVTAALKKVEDDLGAQGLDMANIAVPASDASLTGSLGSAQQGPFLAASAASSGVVPGVEVKGDAAVALTLRFPSPQPDYASPAQLTRLLNDELNKLDVHKFRLDAAPGAVGRQGRFSRMVLTLGEAGQGDFKKDAIPATDFRDALAKVRKEFNNTPQPERLENFDSQLAADTQQKALYAILASWIVILIYLWFRFGSWTFGAATVICLMHDLFFTLGAIALCHFVYWIPVIGQPVNVFGLFTFSLGIQDFKIDLPSVAALLTLVGYSVSDTIVVFDRIREVRGKNPLLTYTMINDSVNQTLSRTILSSLTVFLVVGVLYVAGGEGVHLFAFIMVVGVVVGTYSSIYIASPLLIMFGEGTPRTERAKAAAAQAAAAAAAAQA
jgi:SecD/SecF fusion protein